jgi:hypothetical protein
MFSKESAIGAHDMQAARQRRRHGTEPVARHVTRILVIHSVDNMVIQAVNDPRQIERPGLYGQRIWQKD